VVSLPALGITRTVVVLGTSAFLSLTVQSSPPFTRANRVLVYSA